VVALRKPEPDRGGRGRQGGEPKTRGRYLTRPSTACVFKFKRALATHRARCYYPCFPPYFKILVTLTKWLSDFKKKTLYLYNGNYSDFFTVLKRFTLVCTVMLCLLCIIVTFKKIKNAINLGSASEPFCERY
jgi:hypothetical protein